jgi:hypothetical protein
MWNMYTTNWNREMPVRLHPHIDKTRSLSDDPRRADIERQRLAEEQRTQIETAERLEKEKNKKWTRDDLIQLVYEQEKILDEHFWEPDTFEDDFHLIEAQIAKEKWQILLDGVEKDPISADGINYLYGKLLEEHILKKHFYIEIDTNGQPILHDTIPSPDANRIEQKEGLQRVLANIEFQTDTNHILRGNDNIPRIATYIAAIAYHGQKEKNLIKYRESLRKKIQKDPNKPLTKEDIRNSTELTSSQKSFYLAWHDKSTDRELIEIQTNQENYVTNAREKFREKTPAQHIQEIWQRPIWKSIELFWAGVIGITLLAFGLKQMFGEKSGIIWKIFGVIMALIGGAIAIPMADKTWQKLGGPEMINGLTTKRPVEKDRAYDNPGSRIPEIVNGGIETTRKWIEEFRLRIAWPQEWLPLVTRTELEPALEKHSVWSMLFLLYDGSPAEQDSYKAFAPGKRNKKQIEATLKNLSVSEKRTLRNLLEQSWNRYMEVHPELKGDSVNTKDLHLVDIIQDINMADSWLNFIPEWMGGTTKKSEVLKIIAPRAKEWWEVDLETLRTHFDPFDQDPVDKKSPAISALMAVIEPNPDSAYATIKAYLKEILPEEKTKLDHTQSLRTFLETKK